MKKLFLLSFMTMVMLSLAAQQPLNGTVTDTKGLPIATATVKSISSAKMTITGADGSFSVQAAAGDEIEITSIGFAPKRIKLSSEKVIIIQLELSPAEMEQVVLVGSRKAGRIKTETTAPVDVISIGQVAAVTARTDLTSLLNYAAPSFNYNKQSGSDGSDHIDLATLRGLGPDQTLVLINGKRRHQTAFVAVFGTRGRGNSGTDLNAFPTSAVERVEILRDGAAAQYGSDAIAGVINIITKKSTQQVSGSIGVSGYHDPKFNTAFEPALASFYEQGSKIDGQAFNANVNFGVPLGKKGGFLNLTFEGQSLGKTFRQALKTENYQTDNDAMYTNVYRRGHGEASLNAVGTFYNLEVPGKGKTSLYSFGSLNTKSSDAFAFTRNWSMRPDRFPTLQNGTLNLVQGIMKEDADGEIFYSPHIQTRIQDWSTTSGLKGVAAGAWSWDLSNTTGKNDYRFMGDKTFNTSLGANQTHFDDGGFSYLQNTTNLNFSRAFSTGMNLGMGAEYRYENYQISAGEKASYHNYDATGQKASGAQGFPGFQPVDEVNASRSVMGLYADAEFDVNKKLLLNLAARLESYSDFGFTHNYKFAMRFKVNPTINWRSSLSTGFRAPSLQQINYSSTFTTVQAGTIAEVKIAPNYSALAKAAGIPELNQEKSLSGGTGFTWKVNKSLNITVDGYWTQVKDRVVLSGQFYADDPQLDPVLANLMNGLKVSYAQFFANGVNTTNYGIDYVIEYSKKMGAHKFKALLTGNFQQMSIDKINVPAKLSGSSFLQQSFLSDREQYFILASAPGMRSALNLEYGKEKLTAGLRLTYFGKIELLGYGQDGLGIAPTVPLDNGSGDVADLHPYSAKMVTDLYVSRPIAKNFILTAGIDNVLNVHPDFGVAAGAKDWAYNNETGGPWDAVQMGGNGRRLFLRVGFTF
jgi:iron complex outermembrane receptor protein